MDPMGILPGIVQWFRFLEYESVESAVDMMLDLGVHELRTAFSWADWERPGGIAWLDWLVDYCYRHSIELFPTLFYTPAHRALLLPGQAIEDARTSFPPERVMDYADFCEAMIFRYGDRISDWYQIWNEANNDAYWSPKHDPNQEYFASMAKLAIDVFRAHGKHVLLGGIIPIYTPWIRRMRSLGILGAVDGIGIHAFPGTWDKMEWRGWPAAIQMVRDELEGQEVWITETGFSTATLSDQSASTQALRERGQIRYFDEVCTAPADRTFWFSLHDQALDHPTDNALVRGTTSDPRAYYFGLSTRGERKKLLYYYWKSLAEGGAHKRKAA